MKSYKTLEAIAIEAKIGTRDMIFLAVHIGHPSSQAKEIPRASGAGN